MANSGVRDLAHDRGAVNVAVMFAAPNEGVRDATEETFPEVIPDPQADFLSPLIEKIPPHEPRNET